jgi:hypothetical protein
MGILGILHPPCGTKGERKLTELKAKWAAKVAGTSID